MKLILSLWMAASAAYGASALPVGFSDEIVLEHDNCIVNMEFIRSAKSKTYSILIGNREGQIYLVPDGDNPTTKQLVADLSDRLCNDGSRGLLGVTAHPDFDTKPWIYLYYTRITDGACNLSRQNGPVNRFARYNLTTENLLDLNTELILFETSPTVYHLHNGGKAHFGNDGMIWMTTGDGGFIEVAQDWKDLLGKFIRLTEDGDIPPDGNAYAGQRAVRCNESGIPPPGSSPKARCAEIWARGFRNPFRFSKDPNTGKNTTRFFINDVGGGTWEEVSVGGSDYKGVNYGWGDLEGPCVRNSATDCAVENKYDDPEFWYIHDGIKGPGGGGAIVGGSVIPNGLWPAEYDGRYLFADYVYGEMYLLEPSAGCRECIPPLPNYVNSTFQTVTKPMNVEFGPYNGTQALYYTSWDTKTSALHRVIYNGDVKNRPPVAVLTSNVSFVDVGGWVSFDASASSDPDGDILRYGFDFGQGDGYTKYNKSPLISYQFNTPSKFRVKVRVRHTIPEKARDTDFVWIVVGNLPKVEIRSPLEGAQFAVGDVITAVGHATDYDGNRLPSRFFSWEVRKHHNTHWHPFKAGTGRKLVLPAAPNPEDFWAATNSYLELILTVRDFDGLEQVVRRKIMPKLVELDFDTDPSGLKLTLFHQDLVMPQRVSCWENQQLSVAPFEDNGPYEFEGWSDGGTKKHVIYVPAKSDTVPLFVAAFSSSD